VSTQTPDGCKKQVFVAKGGHTKPIETTVEVTELPAFLRLTRNLPTVYAV
jgi:hypothetical protein